MSRRTLRPRMDICHLCDSMISRQSLSRHPIRPRKSTSIVRTGFGSSRRSYSSKVQQPNGKTEATIRTAHPTSDATKASNVDKPRVDLELSLVRVKGAIGALLSQETIPTTKETVQVLNLCEMLANALVHEPKTPPSDKKDRAASALLSLDDTGSKKDESLKSPPNTERMQDELSKLVYSIIAHPPIFIAPEVLKLYTRVQSILKRPETFPDVLSLYANKPVPEEGSSPIKYNAPSPDKVANAIPKPVADLALQTAIEAKQLVVAMDIIESSYATKAFRRAKFVRQGLLPATGVAVTPIAAYTLASQLALLQTTMETGMATNVAFAGMLAYVGFTATIGIVAVTTANDQMDRVTWTPGLPLRQRWIREEERAAIDRVAGAWGFREIWRRGEEEGEEWEALREWIGLKGMILDRTELMEGME